MAKGRGPKHTACRRGENVVVKLLNGTKIYDKFVERKHGTIYLERYGGVTKGEMSSFAVLKKRL